MIVVNVLRRGWATLLIVAMLVVAGVISRGLRGPDAALRRALATGYVSVVERGEWWTPLTSAFFTDGGPELVVVVIAALIVLGICERLLGPGRLLLAYVVSAVLGIALGIVVQATGIAVHEVWSVRVDDVATFDPITPIAGVLMAASALMGRLWRRRIRVATLSVVAVFVLYSGEPADLYRLFAAITGLALGFLLHHDDNAPFWPRSSHHERRVLLAVVVAIGALGPLVTVFNKVRIGPLAPLGLLLMSRPSRSSFPSVLQCQSALAHGCVHSIALQRVSGIGPVLSTILPLLTLLVAALAIRRGRRFGAWLAIVVNLVMSVMAALYYGVFPLFPLSATIRLSLFGEWERALDLVICTVVPLGIAVFVFINIRHLTVRAARPLIRWYLGSVVGALVITATLYVSIGWILRSQFRPRASLRDLIADLPDRYAPIGFLKLEPITFEPVGPVVVFLQDWVGPAFWIAVILGAVAVAFRPSRRAIWGHARALELLRAEGGGSLSYWSVWEGNHYWFSANGRASVAYRVVNGIAVTTSEPFGAPDAALAAVTEFARFCDDNSWIPFFYGIHPQFAGVCREMGWSADIIGDETIVYPADWNTAGKHWQDVRSSINRAEREGLTATWTRFSELTARHVIQIEEISELWVAEKGLPEMEFTLGGIDELRDENVRLMVAIDAGNDVVGVTSWLPSFLGGVTIGWTLDFMRRAPTGPNGVMEFLIARAVEQFRADGIEFVSLSTAPLTRSSTSKQESSSIAPLLRYIGNRLEPVYGFTSLFNFKRKFQPEFRPVYMAYPDSLSLPTIGLALARTYVPSLSFREAVNLVRLLNRRP